MMYTTIIECFGYIKGNMGHTLWCCLVVDIETGAEHWFRTDAPSNLRLELQEAHGIDPSGIYTCTPVYVNRARFKELSKGVGYYA